MKKKSIAYCIATYNHPAIIQEIIGKLVDLYNEYEIDIYLYDSSESNETRDIMTGFMEKGHDNIYYIRIDPTINVDEKIVLIFSGYGQKKQYDYIWPVKDRVYYKRDTIQAIMAELDSGYNAIFLGVSTYPWILSDLNLSNTVYENPVDFFRDWGWLATSLESTIFHYNSMLKDVDWQAFKDTYFVDGNNGFDHFVVLFTGLAKLKKPVVKVLKNEHISVSNSKQAKSSWIRNAFMVWANLWPKAVNSLPDCYGDYKSQVMKQTAMLPWIFGSHKRLRQFHEAGGLTHEIFEDYRAVWNTLTDIPEEDVELILEKRYDEVQEKIKDELLAMILNKEYEKAYLFFTLNSQLVYSLGNCNYWILNNCFRIQKSASDKGINSGIFENIQTLEDVIEKYRCMKYFLREIENGIGEGDHTKFYLEHSDWFVSAEFPLVIIVRECMMKENLFIKLQELLAQFK